MLIKRTDPSAPRASEITPLPVYARRRGLLSGAVAGFGGAALARVAASQPSASSAPAAESRLPARPGPFSTIEKPTPYRDVTGYNNFYEFGTDKSDPARYAKSLRVNPWALTVDGEVRRPATFDIDALRAMAAMEERIYRMRCVEGWSMVIPWIGFPLSELIRRVEPTGNARFVTFTTLADRKQMPGLSSTVLDWPYVEGLRLDEARHPLTLLTFGLYGEVLPRQNGAPLRIVVPWKYGFKSAKSVVRIRFVEQMPETSWHRSAPGEYGFYSNVNPDVDHPRWSQATERRIGEDGVFQRKRRTLMFNGYAEQVASLYAGMDLRRDF